MIGKSFGRLTVQSESGRNKHLNKIWLLKCTCGGTAYATTANLNNGHHTSCGCRRKEGRRKTHGMTGKHPLYGVWTSMRQRCRDENHHKFKQYGGRGIKVCKQWESFEKFFSWAKNRWQKGFELHRKNSNGNYSPINCTFLSDEEHNKQSKRSDRVLTYNGKSQRVSDWAKELMVYPSTINMRLDQYGWSVEQALSKGGKPNSALNLANKKPPIQETI